MRLMLYHVFSNAEILHRLRSELITAGPPDVVMDLQKLEQLPYLTAIILEALRLSPGIGSRMAPIVPDRDLLLGDWRIPAGTPVEMTTILMHTDERLYPEPFSFHPERWMDVEKRKKSSKTYAPFSRGTRICAGMQYVHLSAPLMQLGVFYPSFTDAVLWSSLAWADLYITLAALALRFNFEFHDIQASDFRMIRDEFVIGTKAKSLLKCRVTLRDI
jgi:cytochrome P450